MLNLVDDLNAAFIQCNSKTKSYKNHIIAEREQERTTSASVLTSVSMLQRVIVVTLSICCSVDLLLCRSVCVVRSQRSLLLNFDESNHPHTRFYTSSHRGL